MSGLAVSFWNIKGAWWQACLQAQQQTGDSAVRRLISCAFACEALCSLLSRPWMHTRLLFSTVSSC